MWGGFECVVLGGIWDDLEIEVLWVIKLEKFMKIVQKIIQEFFMGKFKIFVTDAQSPNP
jgi:hypothetical protein